MFAPVTRYFDYDPVKKQMSKIHKPHRESSYITKAQLEEAVDEQGNKDWEMLYTLGPKAVAEYQAFARKGLAAPPLAALPAPLRPEIPSRPDQAQITFDLTGTYSGLIGELTRLGIAEKRHQKQRVAGSASPGTDSHTVRLHYGDLRWERLARSQGVGFWFPPKV